MHRRTIRYMSKHESSKISVGRWRAGGRRSVPIVKPSERTGCASGLSTTMSRGKHVDQYLLGEMRRHLQANGIRPAARPGRDGG